MQVELDGVPFRGFIDLVPGAEMVMLPGVGHVPMYDDPRHVADSILHVTTAADAAASRLPHHQQGAS